MRPSEAQHAATSIRNLQYPAACNREMLIDRPSRINPLGGIKCWENKDDEKRSVPGSYLSSTCKLEIAYYLASASEASWRLIWDWKAKRCTATCKHQRPSP